MIFAYAFRSLLAHRGASLVAIFVVAVTAGGITTLFGFVHGARAAVFEGGAPEVAVVMTSGSPSDTQSRVATPEVEKLAVLPQIAKNTAGATMLSPEVVISVPYLRNDGQLKTLRVRGVSPIAYEVHPGIRIDGRTPGRGEVGVLLGAKQLGLLADFKKGGTVRLGKKEWPVLGVIYALDSPFESEIWVDREVITTAFHLTTNNIAYAKLTSAGEQAGFTAAVAAIPGERHRLVAASERAFVIRGGDQLAIYFDVIFGIIALLAVGALLCSINTMYTLMLARSVELSTLMAIGYTRTQVAMNMVFESIVLASTGGIIGACVALAVRDQRLSLPGAGLVVPIQISPTVLLTGVAAAVAIGLVGSFVSALQVYRLHILDGLRNG